MRRYFGPGSAIELRRYARNRILRILPLYLVAVIVLLLIQEHGGTWGQWWRFLTLSQNYSTHTILTVDGPMWSLVVEIHFYLLLPLLAYGLAWASSRSRARAAVILVLLGVVSWFINRHAVDASGRRVLLEYSLPATFMYFVPGMLLALLRLQWMERRPDWLRGPLASGQVWLIGAIAFALLQFRDYSSPTMIAIATFLAVGACVLPLRHGRLVRWLDWRPLAVIGVASYSLYIWHDPIVTWLGGLSGLPHGYLAQLAIAGGVCVAVALISYRVIETPFLRLRRPWSPSGAPAEISAPEPLPAPALGELRTGVEQEHRVGVAEA